MLILFFMEISLKGSLYFAVTGISDPHIRVFVNDALDHAPEQFWTDPCSGSGKYHPPEDQGLGGVVRHLVKGAAIASELCRYYNLADMDRNIVIAATILHDIKKNGEPWGTITTKDHGLTAYNWLGQFDLKNPEKDEIRDCVRYHMWRWAEPEEEKARAMKPTLNESIVQLTDYFSSRKCASFLPGINLSEEQIRNYTR
jgi:putative nucleotidyltransferase with HDIG domain